MVRKLISFPLPTPDWDNDRYIQTNGLWVNLKITNQGFVKAYINAVKPGHYFLQSTTATYINNAIQIGRIARGVKRKNQRILPKNYTLFHMNEYLKILYKRGLITTERYKSMGVNPEPLTKEEFKEYRKRRRKYLEYLYGDRPRLYNEVKRMGLME
jgi:hypothetical protein